MNVVSALPSLAALATPNQLWAAADTGKGGYGGDGAGDGNNSDGEAGSDGGSAG